MQLKFGSFPVVVASSAEMAKEFLKTHDHVFASRPKTAAGKYTAYNYHNITWSPYGPYWRQGRKPVMLKDHLFRLTLSIISRIALSKKYVSDESKYETSIMRPEEFQEMLDELFLLNAVFNIGDWIPWLDFLDLQGYVKRMKGLRKKFDPFLDHVFDEHKAKKEGGNDFIPMDTVDLLLQLADDPNIDVKLTYDRIKALTQVISLPF
nr:flavonoid 3'-monooxygenase [Quercus suber]